MLLLNVKIQKIIIHQVYRRDEHGGKVKPFKSLEYTDFSDSAMEVFKSRVLDALGEGSKAVQMEITQQLNSDLPRIMDQLMEKNDDEFAVSSYDVANKLADAQKSKSIPGGIVVIFDGTYSAKRKKFIGVIKAEIYSGYEKSREEGTNKISLKYVEELLLTPSSKLYKTAAFFEKANYSNDVSDLNEKWMVLISDNQISKADGKAAARYFYSDFLGCDYPKTSARVTKEFYDATKKFISSLGISEIEKNDLNNALTIYLRVDKSGTASSADFASRYFNDVDIHDSYVDKMRSSGIPSGSFTKDIKHIKSKLDIRNVKFKNNIKIVASPESFKDLISMELIDGDFDEMGNLLKWTKVIIKDRIISQE